MISRQRVIKHVIISRCLPEYRRVCCDYNGCVCVDREIARRMQCMMSVTQTCDVLYDEAEQVFRDVPEGERMRQEICQLDWEPYTITAASEETLALCNAIGYRIRQDSFKQDIFIFIHYKPRIAAAILDL